MIHKKIFKTDSPVKIKVHSYEFKFSLGHPWLIDLKVQFNPRHFIMKCERKVNPLNHRGGTKYELKGHVS